MLCGRFVPFILFFFFVVRDNYKGIRELFLGLLRSLLFLYFMDIYNGFLEKGVRHHKDRQAVIQDNNLTAR